MIQLRPLNKKHTVAGERATSCTAMTLAPVIHRLLHSKCAQSEIDDISAALVAAQGDKAL
jgi:hypothetical protein